MTFDWTNKSSFLFAGVDMYIRFGLQITENGLPKDVLLPGLRSRKVTIPQRSGAYDFGAKYYNERPFSIEVVTVRSGTREDAREMAYVLSKKSEIRFWNEPDKYYLGRIYEAPDLDILRNIGNRFSLTFIAEPFAYGATKTDPMTDLFYLPNYKGTAATPTYIVIENTGTIPATNIQIVQTNRKENL